MTENHWLPCAACWDAVLDGIAQHELTGSATDHCPHRQLGFVIHATNGEPRRWAVSRMTAQEVEARVQLVRRKLFEQNGLKPVK